MKTILLFLFSLSLVVAIAQPSISSNVIAPIGYTSRYYKSNAVSSFNPGNAGTNATWNFSAIDTLGGSVSQKSVLPDTTFFFSDFPSAVNYASEVTSFLGNIYGYAHLDNTTFDYYGTKSFAAAQVYTDPEKQLAFPFTYNSQFTDYFHDADSTYFGHVTVKGDAFGTLILPTGTYSNVLRINIKEDYREYTDWDFNGDPIDSTLYDGQYYRWYLPNHVNPLLEYSKLVSYLTFQGTRYDIDSLKHLVMSKNTITSIEEPEFSFHIEASPNPAGKMLFFSCEVAVAKVQVTDLCGKLLIEERFDQNSFALNFEDLHAGTYCVQVFTTDNRSKTIKVLHL